MDAVAEYLAASEANDIERLLATLTEDAEVVSPLSARLVFRGRDDVRVLLGAVYGTLAGLRWHGELGDHSRGFAIGRARVGPLQIDDAMVFELAADGRIERVRPHLRPWLATTLFALTLGVRLVRHPTVLWRAARRGTTLRLEGSPAD
jgi:hypothetical protein